MRCFLFATIIGIVLVGCIPKVQKEQPYDIDVTCNNQTGNAFEICDPLQREKCDEKTTRFDCYNPTFHIKCDKSTVQIMDSTYLCSTSDGKTVHILLKNT